MSRVHRSAAPRARLLCFPHGGRGPSLYRPWSSLLPADIELRAVSLPGRESRWDEAVPDDLPTMVDDLQHTVRSLLDDVPVVFFGHSLGALLAVELGRRLTAGAGRAPVHLVASGCRPPQDPDPMADAADLPDADLAVVLGRLGGTAPEILANPEALDLVLPAVRADLRLARSYRLPEAPVLACPVTVLVGDADPESAATDPGRWAAMTTAECEVRRFPGGHFFVERSLPLVVSVAVQVLLPHLR